ncbi:hypothetical protein C1645_769123 [Glomus cerebriforme]|uniref:Uncharacterized protein n=1 Tax=Glomus cerebriforme TaxID=658196 RepID=A0A397T0E6_9GLOM|nr:hypothetical protein C1645_769123 [Glomus cerebriforme]
MKILLRILRFTRQIAKETFRKMFKEEGFVSLFALLMLIKLVNNNFFYKLSHLEKILSP